MSTIIHHLFFRKCYCYAPPSTQIKLFDEMEICTCTKTKKIVVESGRQIREHKVQNLGDTFLPTKNSRINQMPRVEKSERKIKPRSNHKIRVRIRAPHKTFV